MKSIYKSVALLGFSVSSFSFASLASAYPALYYRYRQLTVNQSACLSTAQEAVRGVGLQNIGGDKITSGGTTPSVRAFITCMSSPNARACGGNGSTVMFVAASDKSGDDANAVLARLDDKFGNPINIDCGPVIIPSH